ncbi:glycosyltransferase [Halobacteriovorax sp. GB3]|uniref:glycosyltransferase n=1 Tax=Halobacteriovorax sp. GB3 TaxID=2719615 RepID=UPI0023609585|nr:glycosyltransferase [Halobacteriovorax sp. GB3]MDD0852544.1 glycosyltransferase [Halobacteriovorax sp. GB3]
MLTNKKILQITVRSDQGGGPKHLFDLIKAMDTKKYSVSVVSPVDEPFYGLYKNLCETHIEIPHRKFSIISFLKILLFCRENGIQIVHSHGLGAGIYSRLLGLFGLKVIHTFHGIHYPKSLSDKVKINLGVLLKYFTDTFICVSHSEMDNAVNLNQCFSNQTIVIANGIDEAKYICSKREDGPITQISSISRLDEHKNISETLRFLAKLKNEKSFQFFYNIAGDGDQKEELKSLVKELELQEETVFLGNVDDVAGLLSKTDLFVSSSKGEGLPYSILEAMAANCKILCSNVTGHKDLLSGHNLYDLGNYESFKDSILKVERVSFDKKYSIESMVNSVQDIYSSF